MRKIFADAITAALNRIGFPWSTPRQPVASTDAMFAETVTDNDLREMFRRNQAAHAIVADVAFDALTSFTCLTPKGDPTEKFNAEAHQIYDTFIAQPLRRALVLSRLYGFCGLLVGYDDDARFSAPYTLKSKSKISYLQSIPKPWVSEIDLVKDKAGTLMLPPEVESYDLKTLSERKIHASRLIHLYNPDVDEENMEGESVLLSIFDSLTVLKSMDWGTGQAMWRNGGGLSAFIAPPGANQPQIDAIDDVVKNINAKTVITLPSGTEMKDSRPSALDPEKYYSVVLQQIAIGSRIPLSILTGSQRGTLTASEKDRKDYFELLDNIQKNLLTPTLYNLFARFQASGQLAAKEFIIKWDRTPIWLIEEAKGQLYLAQTEVQKSKAQREAAQAKREELKLKEYREELRAKREQTSASADALTNLPGFIVPPPHGELIWRGLQKAVVKPVQLTSHITEPIYLLAGDSCYGIILLDNAKEIDLKEFEKLTPQHLVSDTERSSLWKGKRKLFFYPVRLLTLFPRPRRCSYAQDAKNFVKHVEFV